MCSRGRGKEPEEADRRQLRASSDSNGGRLEESIPVDLAREKLGRGLGKMEELTTNPFMRSI